MKKYFTHSLFVASIVAMSFTTVACDSENSSSADLEKEKGLSMTAISQQYTKSTVIATYQGLADKCGQLADVLDVLSSQSDLERSCQLWKEARQYWEWSEAFLFGAASSYGIDPHIDTWPFDAAAFNANLKGFDPENNNSVNAMAEVVDNGQNLTGFHALEYLIFRDGKNRQLADLTVQELAYAKLVSQDLYLSAVRLEAAWKGIDNISESRQELLAEAEKEPNDNFGDYMIYAGKAGSIYRTATLAVFQIIDGCKDIVDEVAHAKIGSPATGEDPNYIESPHAYNSIQDFYDNLLSCQYALFGSLGATAPQPNSVMAYAQEHLPAEYQTTKQTLEAALFSIQSMKEPFVLYYTDQTALKAIAAIEAFDDALSELQSEIQK